MFDVPSTDMPPEVTRVALRDSLFFLFLLFSLFLPLVILSRFPPFPPKHSAAPGLAEQSDTGTKPVSIPSSLSSGWHNLILCHGRSLAHDSPMQTTYKYLHPEGNTKPQTPCTLAQRKRKQEVSAPLATALRLLWPSGKLGQQDKSAESFLPPPKEKQLTKRVCLNSVEKLTLNKQVQDLSLDEDCHCQR